MSRIWSVILAMIRPPPSRPSEIAVVSTMAMVMVMLRRNPFRTSVTTNPARMCSSRVPPWLMDGSVSRLPAHPVHAARFVPDDLAELKFDDPPPHGVDDGVVVCRHQHRGAGAI